MLSPCGADCAKCAAHPSQCGGCRKQRGRSWWAEYSGMPCPVYACCVDSRKFQDCSRCKELPCRKIYEARVPGITEAQHRAAVNERVSALKRGGSGGEKKRGFFGLFKG